MRQAKWVWRRSNSVSIFPIVYIVCKATFYKRLHQNGSICSKDTGSWIIARKKRKQRNYLLCLTVSCNWYLRARTTYLAWLHLNWWLTHTKKPNNHKKTKQNRLVNKLVKIGTFKFRWWISSKIFWKIFSTRFFMYLILFYW